MADSIQATKQGFEKSFQEGTLYNRQTQDEEHLQRILEAVKIEHHNDILDLGTGSGYLAFAMAKAAPAANVTGLDIVEKALEENRRIASEKQLQNVTFTAYDGMDFPFPEEAFDLITTRYALHHFPDIQHTFAQVSRILKKGGQFFIADPTPNEGDDERFVDDYMRMKPDGHIKYYEKAEFEEYASEAGLQLVDAFQTEICFPRLKETAVGFDSIMNRHNKDVIEGYKVRVTDDGKYIYITQKVWNLLFEKKG